MCITPIKIANVGFVACRECKLCRENKTMDLVGRCIAEHRYADKSMILTLTYGGDVPGAAVLTYRDVQIMLKHLRNDGFEFKFVAVGEQGDKKERCHWHVALFFRGNYPDAEYGVSKYTWKYWRHGFTYVDFLTVASVRYALKYVQKDPGHKQHFLSYSKNPPLGFEYFRDLAWRYAEQGLAPQDFFYAFPEERKKSGELRKFMLQGVSRRKYVQAFLDAWETLRPEQEIHSPVLRDYADEKIRNDPWWSRYKHHREMLAKYPGLDPAKITEAYSENEDTQICVDEWGDVFRFKLDKEGKVIWRKRCDAASAEKLRNEMKWQGKRLSSGMK